MARRSAMMPGVVHSEAPLGQETFWRDEELLVIEEDVRHQALRAELEGRDYDVAAGIRRYRLPGRDVDELVAKARNYPGLPPRVSVNHLFAAQHRPPWYRHSHETYHFANFEAPKPVAPPSNFDSAFSTSKPGAVKVGILDTSIGNPLLRDRTQVFGAAPEQAGMRTDEAVGHGTLVAGSIASRAPQAELIACPVMDGNGVVEEFLVIQALDRPQLGSCAVLNLSFAAYTEDDQPPPALSTVLGRYKEQGHVLVAAAGNGGDSRIRWPAALPDVIAVGALDSTGTPWRYSDYGPWVDVWAPGVDVISTYKDAGWAEWTGTSAAAAQVSGAIAALVEQQEIDPISAAARLMESSRLETLQAQLPGRAERDQRRAVNPQVRAVELMPDGSVVLTVKVVGIAPGRSVEISGYITQNSGAFAPFHDIRTLPVPDPTDLASILTVTVRRTELVVGEDVTVVTRVAEVWSTALRAGVPGPSTRSVWYAD